MIKIDNILVCANFDSGKFMNTFSVSESCDGYSEELSNIQRVHNLSFDDFNNLSMIIASSINEYLKSIKEK